MRNLTILFRTDRTLLLELSGSSQVSGFSLYDSKLINFRKKLIKQTFTSMLDFQSGANSIELGKILREFERFTYQLIFNDQHLVLTKLFKLF